MSQRDIVLRMLRERGAEGVSSHEFTYRHGITRAAAVVFTLRQEGFEIETRDEGQTPDGREKMARYVLKGTPAFARPKGPPDEAIPLPPAVDLPFDCGCVRAADGRSWVSRCENHAPTPARVKETQW